MLMQLEKEKKKHKSRIEELQVCIEEEQRKLKEAIEEKCPLFKTNFELNKILEGYNRVFDEIKKREEEIQQMWKSIKDGNERILGRIEEVGKKVEIIAKNADNLKAKKKEKKFREGENLRHKSRIEELQACMEENGSSLNICAASGK
eukprot:gene10102-11136_t